MDEQADPARTTVSPTLLGGIPRPGRSEIDAAVAAVRSAMRLCTATQGRLLGGDTLTKGDDSPVTVADFAAQAVVCATLSERLGTLALVGEEDATDLEASDTADLLQGVVDLVNTERPAAVDDVLDWIRLGTGDASVGRFWTLDPIDGTKGFLRGDQYAIALGLIEHGSVRLGVLGCPNLPNPDGSIGAMFVADGDGCVAYWGDSDVAVPVEVDGVEDLAHARFCESVESGHSDQGQSAAIAARLGIVTEPYRIDSQCKYAAVARGDASIYLRLPTRADYREKIWDHAAGMFVVECAGGRVTDVTGAPLDFRHGRRLETNRGVVATSGRFHDDVIAAVGHVLGS
jgi:3'(2'), 5'-bisphosphate nucleotidase